MGERLLQLMGGVPIHYQQTFFDLSVDFAKM